MIHEFAVEPELLRRWTSRQALAFFVQTVGLGTPRVLAALPSAVEWRRAALKDLDSLSQNDQLRLTTLVEHLSRLTSLRTPINVDPLKWPSSALAEHARRSLQPIICVEAGGAACTEDVIWDDLPPWKASMSRVVSRDPDALVNMLGPLLRAAKEFVLVDPHFEPRRSGAGDWFTATLERIVSAVVAQRADAEKPGRIEVLTGREVDGQALHQSLDSVLPSGTRVKVVRYWSAAGGDKDHNRYILTELGGVGVITGLDVGGASEKLKHTDDLHVLSREMYEKRYAQYVWRNTNDFEFKDVTTLVGVRGLASTVSEGDDQRRRGAGVKNAAIRRRGPR
ncbi:hypothetical protein LXT21_42265 [Myxococcus sp. K38C18041901]|uniref:hypothetical protein n=1 Tax=Myxococcus guangdongensis TaxID=2906760 RepID=UPI0020A73751|nr:hypothetical protein [Myxococcus guangdongensis]MCP3065411.1 hypothetical protein [Myxococcus guangdongensis]